MDGSRINAVARQTMLAKKTEHGNIVLPRAETMEDVDMGPGTVVMENMNSKP